MPWPVAHGPDIAHYQDITGEPVDPTWRLCSHKCSEGANSGDATFPSRWKWMRTQGFQYRGAYHWLRSDSTIAAQAANIIRRIDAQGGLWQGEFIQSDWETTPNIHVNEASDEREFCDRLAQHYGRACTITYSSDWIPDSPDDSDTTGEFYNWLNLTQGRAPLWFANYNTTPTNPQGGQQECARYGADVWQFTSSFRHPSIVSRSGGGFDMNHVLKWATLDRIAGYTSAQLPPPGQHPEPVPPPPPPTGEPMAPYLFRLPDGNVGLRDVTGCRPVSGDELLGPFAGERVWDVPAGGSWKHFIDKEMAKYERELDPPSIVVNVPDGGVAAPSGFVGSITLTPTD